MPKPKSLYRSIAVIYEDDDIILLNKPYNVLTLPDRYNEELINLYQFLQKRLKIKIFIVHRLDRETSGIICFAKNETAHKKLSQQFQERTTTKIYHAIVKGCLHNKEGKIDLSIMENPAKRGTMKVSKLGKPSLTLYKVSEQFKHYSYLSVEIKTGRMHQIRVHFQAIGYPLAVDPTYGGEDGFYLSSVKHRYNRKGYEKERPIINRVSLHAHSLTFTHPTTNEIQTYTAPLHKDFEVMLKQLRKYDLGDVW